MLSEEVSRWLVISNGSFVLSADGLWHFSMPDEYLIDLPLGIFPARVVLIGETQEQTISLRDLMASSAAEDFQAAARASQLEHWWSHHRFCGRCGTETVMHQSEFALSCPSCHALYFPRISPCIITLVYQDKHCLLAKHSRSRSGNYSVLAGFIEAGESAEQALIREIKEEVGLTVGNLEYVTSQNWPFPSQLMLGFLAEYKGDKDQISIDQQEIVDAKWFTFDNLPDIPPEGTISRQLIDIFIQRKSHNN